MGRRVRLLPITMVASLLVTFAPTAVAQVTVDTWYVPGESLNLVDVQWDRVGALWEQGSDGEGNRYTAYRGVIFNQLPTPEVLTCIVSEALQDAQGQGQHDPTDWIEECM